MILRIAGLMIFFLKGDDSAWLSLESLLGTTKVPLSEEIEVKKNPVLPAGMGKPFCFFMELLNITSELNWTISAEIGKVSGRIKLT
jgi:hypothetical protein